MSESMPESQPGAPTAGGLTFPQLEWIAKQTEATLDNPLFEFEGKAFKVTGGYGSAPSGPYENIVFECVPSGEMVGRAQHREWKSEQRNQKLSG